MNNVIQFPTSPPSKSRKPLYNKDSSPHLKGPANKSVDFGDRVSRIRASLERINVLMGELKSMPAEAQAKFGARDNKCPPSK